MKTAFPLLLLALSAASAPAAIVYSGIKDLTISSTFDSLFLNIDNAATSGSEMSGWDVEVFFGGEGFGNSETFQPVRQTTAADSPIVPLESGATVDLSGIYAISYAGSDSHVGPGANQFQSGETAYLGFRFTPDAGGGPYYGWMQVIFSNTGGEGKIIDWAYEDSGAAITVGAVPEPSMAALAMLSLPFLLTRRRAAVSR